MMIGMCLGCGLQGNTELESFMLEMGQLLGDHFTKVPRFRPMNLLRTA